MDRKRNTGVKRRQKGRKRPLLAAPGWTKQVLLPNSLLQALRPHLEGITSPEMHVGSWLRQQRGLAVWGLHLGQPLLHAADVVVQPPGAADLGQTVFLVGQQGALQSIRGPESCLQWAIVMRRVWRRGAPFCAASHVPVGELLPSGCTKHLPPREDGQSQTGERKAPGDMEARLPTVSSPVVLYFEIGSLFFFF